jgi:hypothetical protein
MDDYCERQRQAALKLAPAEEIDEAQLRAMLADVPLRQLRRAAIRWSAPRGRSREQIIDGIVTALQNPHINRGDSFRIALGHVRTCSAHSASNLAQSNMAEQNPAC